MKIQEPGVLETSEFYSHSPSEFSKKHLFTLHFAGRYDCNIEYVIERSFHDYFLVLRIIKGQLNLEFGNHVYNASKDDLILLDCRQPHKYYAITDVSFEYIHFKGNISEILYNEITSKFGPIIPLMGNIEIINLVDSLITMFENNDINDNRASYMIHNLLSSLIEDKRHNQTSVESILTIVKFIDLNYRKKIDINELANMALLSLYHFSRIFKNTIGVAPHEYLIMQRIKNAKLLLKNSNNSVNNISEMVGFNSPSHFISTFKRYTNMTPNEFRKFRF